MSKSKCAMKKQLQTMFKGLSRPFCMENAKNGLPKSHEFKLGTFLLVMLIYLPYRSQNTTTDSSKLK